MAVMTVSLPKTDTSHK